MTNSASQEFLKRLGIDIDAETFQLAMTHRSFSFENGGIPHNERLEFLGDSVLSLAVASELYKKFPDLQEGELVKRHHVVVSTRTLADLARRLKLGPCIRLGKGEKKTGGADKDSILADTMEAVYGAVYIAHGPAKAHELVLHHMASMLDDTKTLNTGRDWKTEIQEYAAAQGTGEPVYQVEGTGPDHARRFTAKLLLAGKVVGTGKGTSKKEAERMAAEEAFHKISQG
ncbi:ribonuclease III [Rothia nasimurium]|uniref:ribonuclease III n=1 Tax=Rothia nasimurium TaxID=85336 RepID=UPI001F0164D3|nr:ribonuclease III [Rothia nasimurium]